MCAIGIFFVLPHDCPAALVWHKGEGWSWEREGVTVANNPKDQLDIARGLEAKKNYDGSNDS